MRRKKNQSTHFYAGSRGDSLPGRVVLCKRAGMWELYLIRFNGCGGEYIEKCELFSDETLAVETARQRSPSLARINRKFF